MRKIKGYITVYLSLVLGVMLLFVTTVIQGVRIQTSRFETECVMDAGLNSIFAEYHRDMLRRYGLLYIDDSYGNSSGHTERTRDHLLYYMNLNFDKETGQVSLTNLHADNAILSDVSFASDNSGEVLRYQISRYVKTNNIAGINSKLIDIDKQMSEFESCEAERLSLNEEINAFVEEYNKNLIDEDKINISNPSESVEFLNSDNVLYYAFENMNGISVKSTDLDKCISRRSYEDGAGLHNMDGVSQKVEDESAVYNYIFSKCGFQGNIKENSKLDYEIEYLICGKESDLENISEVMEAIFKSRYAVNFDYITSDSEKNEEAKTLALTVMAGVDAPELIDKLQKSIVLAWVYVESTRDIRNLMSGNSLSETKSSSTWSTSLDDIVDFRNSIDSYKIQNGIMGYKEYLYSLLSKTDIKTLTIRLMDVMEMDIRLTPGNQYFCMNNMIYQLTASVNVSSTYGVGLSIKRDYSYW